MQRTFAMIKPGALRAGHADKILKMIVDNSFTIIAQKEMQLTKELAEQFYAVHKERPFFGELVEFIISGPVVVLVLEKEGGIRAWRDLMGATDPAQAAEGTIRKMYATSIGANAVHGSDAPETAAEELKLIFPELD